MSRVRYPKYKPTGIAWLPEVPEEWEMRRLKYVITSMRKGNGITKEDVFEDGDLPCVRYGEIYSKYDIRFDECRSKTRKALLASPQYFEKGDILFSCTGELVDEIGKNVVYCGEGRCAAGGDIIVISHAQDPGFLNYYLGSYPSQRQKSFGKAKLKVVHIHALDIQNIVTLLPSCKEQRAIVAYLDEKCGKVDRLVAAKEKEAALLKELKQSMIAEAVTGTTQVAQTDTARKMKPSGIPWLPEVPEGWEVKTLRQFLKLVSRKGFPEKQLLSVTREQGVVVRNIESKEENHNFIPEDLSNYKLVEVGDFAINKMKSWQGSYGVSEHEGIVSPAYYICKLSGVDRSYFSAAIRSRPYVSFFARFSKGIRVDQWDLSPIALKEIPFLLPPLAEQREIVAYIEARAAKIDAAVKGLEREVAALKEYRERLIADVVTGQRKVV